MKRADPAKVQHALDLLREGHSRKEAAEQAGLKLPTLVRYARAAEAARPAQPPVVTTADPWPELGPDELPARPKTWGECAGGLRPCPWVSCRYHLLGLADSQRSWGAAAVLSDDPDVIAETALDLPQTCALDVAERENTLEGVAHLLRLTRERIRQIEGKALDRVHRAGLEIE